MAPGNIYCNVSLIERVRIGSAELPMQEAVLPFGTSVLDSEFIQNIKDTFRMRQDANLQLCSPKSIMMPSLLEVIRGYLAGNENDRNMLKT